VGVRRPNLDHDFWELESGERRHAHAPDTFWIPPPEDRSTLQLGDVAKLLFLIEGDADGSVELQGERMWVVVTHLVDGTYVGRLLDTPCTEETDGFYLRRGVQIPFDAEHVIDLRRPYAADRERLLSEAPVATWER
jgi:hypothetical protein